LIFPSPFTSTSTFGGLTLPPISILTSNPPFFLSFLFPFESFEVELDFDFLSFLSFLSFFPNPKSGNLNPPFPLSSMSTFTSPSTFGGFTFPSPFTSKSTFGGFTFLDPPISTSIPILVLSFFLSFLLPFESLEVELDFDFLSFFPNPKSGNLNPPFPPISKSTFRSKSTPSNSHLNGAVF